MQAKKTYEETIQSNLQAIDERMKSLAAEIDKAGADASQQVEDEMADLRRRRQELNSRFQSLKSAGDDAWTDMKSGLDSALDVMDRTLKRASSRFDKVAA